MPDPNHGRYAQPLLVDQTPKSAYLVASDSINSKQLTGHTSFLLSVVVGRFQNVSEYLC